MAWRVLYHPTALQELARQPDDIVAHLTRIVTLIAEHGPERLPASLPSTSPASFGKSASAAVMALPEPFMLPAAANAS
jgi:hypothetical protein